MDITFATVAAAIGTLPFAVIAEDERTLLVSWVNKLPAISSNEARANVICAVAERLIFDASVHDQCDNAIKADRVRYTASSLLVLA